MTKFASKVKRKSKSSKHGKAKQVAGKNKRASFKRGGRSKLAKTRRAKKGKRLSSGSTADVLTRAPSMPDADLNLEGVAEAAEDEAEEAQGPGQQNRSLKDFSGRIPGCSTSGHVQAPQGCLFLYEAYLPPARQC